MKDCINILRGKKMENKYFNTSSPSFSSFRELMDLWDANCLVAEHEHKIGDLLDKHGLILFFKRGDEIYGAPEESRIIFAKLKNNDEEEPNEIGFKDEARFLGINLLKAMLNNPEESIETSFSNKDIPDLHVCDRDDVIKIMMKNPE